MEAGRELDALVAEKVMGWTYDPGFLPGIVDPYAFPEKVRQQPVWRTGPTTGIWPLPPFSTDIAAAWEVVEKLRTAGFMVGMTALPEYYSLAIHHRTDDQRVGADRADTAPHAICLAALRAQDAL